MVSGLISDVCKGLVVNSRFLGLFVRKIIKGSFFVWELVLGMVVKGY